MPTDDREQWVSAQRIRLLYRQMPIVLAAGIVNTILVVAALWPMADRVWLLGWAGVMAVVLATRLAGWRRYMRRAPTDKEMGFWGRAFAIGSAVAGLLWGASALLFIDFAQPLSLLLIVFVIGGMAAGAVATLSNHPPAFHLYLGTSVSLLSLRLLSEGEGIGWAMAGMSLVFGLALAGIGQRSFANLSENLRLTYDKQQLIAGMEEQIRARTRELEAARVAAEEANRAKSQLLAAASHDLRQPLQSMFLFCELLKPHVGEAQGREVAVRLERGLETLKAILDSLLDISRLDLGLIRAEVTDVHLASILDDILAAYRPIAEAKGLSLRQSCAGDWHVRSDPHLLGRMLRNLLENALRYTDKGSVSVLCTRVADSVRIDIVDTGIGIPADKLACIFEEFYRVAETPSGHHGLGLGLAIVRRLGDILGHRVAASSEAGKGSTFSITVPLNLRAHEKST